MTNEKTIETCTDEEIAMGVKLAHALRARRDAFAAWWEYQCSGSGIPEAEYQRLAAARDDTDHAARGAAEALGDLAPKMAAHLAALKRAAIALDHWLDVEVDAGYEPSLEVDGAMQDVRGLVQS